MKKIDLTFGIPMYNSDKYISDLINCFKNTNKFIYEIVVVNDGSTDDSLNVCKQFNDKNLIIIDKENGGVSSARNMIINNARGEWITFIDSDDLIDFSKYECLFKKIKNGNYDFCFGIRNKKFLNSNTYKLDYLIENEFINSPIDKFYKKEVLDNKNIRFNDKFSLGEDLLFNLEYFKNTNNVKYYYSDNMYIIRNINSESLTHKYRVDKFEELMNVNEKCKKIFNDDKSLKAFEYIRVKNCISCLKDRIMYKKGDLKRFVFDVRKKYPHKYFLFNNISVTLIYNFWYYLPVNLLIFLTKKRFNIK